METLAFQAGSWLIELCHLICRTVNKKARNLGISDCSKVSSRYGKERRDLDSKERTNLSVLRVSGWRFHAWHVRRKGRRQFWKIGAHFLLRNGGSFVEYFGGILVHAVEVHRRSASQHSIEHY